MVEHLFDDEVLVAKVSAHIDPTQVDGDIDRWLRLTVQQSVLTSD